MISKLGSDGGPINIAGVMTLSPTSLYAAYACGSLVLLLFSGATGAIFWIIGKIIVILRIRIFFFKKKIVLNLGASTLLILGHAAVLEPGVEEGFADDQV